MDSNQATQASKTRQLHVGPRRWWALGAITLSVLTIGLDTTVLSVALPTLATVFHASESTLQWFTAGYALALAAAMLPAGLLGDRFGRKKVLVIALGLFAVGSAACALAPSSALFLVARLILGLAGAGITVMAVSAQTVLFSDEERPRAIAVWAGANFLALPLGPILGGWLLSQFWWGWVFLINVPVAIVGLVATVALVPETRAPKRPRLDLAGILASSAGLAAVTYGVIDAGENGWGNPAALGWIAAGIAVLIGFFFLEERASHHPGAGVLFDPALLRSRSFVWGSVLAAVTLVSMTGVLFTMPQFFQGVLGTTAFGSGLGLLPLIAGMVIGLIPADRVAAKLGAKLTVALGLLISAAGLLIGSTTSVASTVLFVSVWMAAVGVGTGLALSTTAAAALSQLPEDRAGVGSAAMQAIQKLGAPFGAAVIGSILIATYQSSLHPTGLSASATSTARQGIFSGLSLAHRLGLASLHSAVQTAFIQGLHSSLLAAAAIVVGSAVVAVVFLPGGPGRRSTAD